MWGWGWVGRGWPGPQTTPPPPPRRREAMAWRAGGGEARGRGGGGRGGEGRRGEAISGACRGLLGEWVRHRIFLSKPCLSYAVQHRPRTGPNPLKRERGDPRSSPASGGLSFD